MSILINLEFIEESRFFCDFHASYILIEMLLFYQNPQKLNNSCFHMQLSVMSNHWYLLCVSLSLCFLLSLAKDFCLILFFSKNKYCIYSFYLCLFLCLSVLSPSVFCFPWLNYFQCLQIRQYNNPFFGNKNFKCNKNTFYLERDSVLSYSLSFYI